MMPISLPGHSVSGWWLGSGKPPPPIHEEGDTTPAAVSSEKKRILIVEDEAFVALAERAILTNAGYEVVGIATHPEEALAQVQEQHPDLVIMDLRLRGNSDGLGAAVAMRLLGIPCVIVSAHLDPETLIRAQAARPLGVLSKPFRDGDLVRLVEEALARCA